MLYQNKTVTQMNSTKRLVFMGLLIAQALVLSYIERWIPLNLWIPIPGVKLGLANSVTIISLYLFSFQEIFLLIIIRTILNAMFVGGFSSFLYSFAGAMLSFLGMFCIQRGLKEKVSPIGVSAIGAMLHNLGQLIVASLVVQNARIMYYLPPLMISGLITGLLIGFTTLYLLQYILRKI